MQCMFTLFHHSTPILKPCWFSMIFPWIHKHNSDLSVCFTLFPWFSLWLQPLFPPRWARRPRRWCRTRSRSHASCRTGNRRSSKWPKLDGNIVGSLGGDRVGIGWDGDGDGFDQLDMEYLYQWITNINGTYHDFPNIWIYVNENSYEFMGFSWTSMSMINGHDRGYDWMDGDWMEMVIGFLWSPPMGYWGFKRWVSPTGQQRYTKMRAMKQRKQWFNQQTSGVNEEDEKNPQALWCRWDRQSRCITKRLAVVWTGQRLPSTCFRAEI